MLLKLHNHKHTISKTHNLLKFKKHKLCTKNTLLVQSYLKFFQLLAPSLLVHLPAVPLFFAPFFDMKFSFRTRVVVYFFSVYPLLDSLILFIVVSDYKHAVRSKYFLELTVSKRPISDVFSEIIANRAVQVLSILNVASVAPTTSTTRYRVAEGVL